MAADKNESPSKDQFNTLFLAAATCGASPVRLTSARLPSNFRLCRAGSGVNTTKVPKSTHYVLIYWLDGRAEDRGIEPLAMLRPDRSDRASPSPTNKERQSKLPFVLVGDAGGEIT